MFGALVNCGCTAGDDVAIAGIGGLGHVGVKLSDAMGFRTTAFTGNKDLKAM